MKKYALVLLFGLFALQQLYAVPDSTVLHVQLNKIGLEFYLDEVGRPVYTLSFGKEKVLNPSVLGFEFTDGTGFNKGLKLTGTSRRSVNEQWKPVWGESNQIRNHYEELKVQLQQQEKPFRKINLIFRVFEDGLGFRYEFPKQVDLKYFVVSRELTEFNMTADHKAFWIPGDYDTNEYSYTTSALSEVDAWAVQNKATDIAVRIVPDQYAVQTPLMLKSAKGLYINIHEAALVNYPAMQLYVDRSHFKLSANLVPDALGNKAYLHAPFSTPWRTVIVSDHAEDILASKMILNLNEPSKIKETNWIKPMKFVGVWWEMQTGKSTWSYASSLDSVNTNGELIPSGKHGANTNNVKRYIDFAAKNGIEGVLVEGWNTGWEDWFGNWKENVFDFVTPYPDFDVRAIADYAHSKGIKMIMHNETSGSATTYERYLDTAFRFMNKYAYPAVKTGYVGKIIPRGEHHDGQWMVNHYERVAQKAAEYKVMLDSHEPNRPTGLHRTYPNWMAYESGRGNEYNAFSNGNHLDHETILPFTRLMGGPMDYTPGIFKLKGYAQADPKRQVHSTLAKQLALYITIYSPLQMVADLPENYENYPDAFEFIKHVAVDWDETKILEAEPGSYISIARKAKGKEEWFIGTITNENSREMVVRMNFLDKGKKYLATIYRDGDKAHWKNNPESYKIDEVKIDASSVLKLRLAEGGGAAIEIRCLSVK
jgi:hypothetical protein